MDNKMRIELEALITEREGMIAENMQRSINGEAMAYHDSNFFALASLMKALLEDDDG